MAVTEQMSWVEWGAVLAVLAGLFCLIRVVFGTPRAYRHYLRCKCHNPQPVQFAGEFPPQEPDVMHGDRWLNTADSVVYRYDARKGTWFPL